MIRHYQNIIGTPVIHFEKGNKIAFIQDIIIDPDQGKIEGFWIKSSKTLISYPILQSQDILEWKKNIYVKNEKVMADPADIIRIKEILTKERFIIGNHVENEEGENYGKVFNLTFNDKTYYLKDIYVQKSFLGFKYQRRIFSSANIIEVLDRAIIVDDDGRKKVETINPVILKKDIADVSGVK